MAMDSFTRRGLLDLAVRVAAIPAGAQFFAAFSKAGEGHRYASGTNVPPDPELLRDYQPQFFNTEDFKALQWFTEILIPSDETPGAREAHCALFIDFLLQADADDDYAGAVRQQWRDAMAALRAAGFHAADARTRNALVEAISLPERDSAAKHSAYFAYRLIKRENTFAFYTARTGTIDNLNYKGNSYNLTFPACTHPEHHSI